MNTLKVLKSIAAACALLFYAGTGLQAQTTWGGGGTGTAWNTSGNWSNGVPVSTTPVIFDDVTAPVRYGVNATGANRNTGSMTFQGSAANNYTITSAAHFVNIIGNLTQNRSGQVIFDAQVGFITTGAGSPSTLTRIITNNGGDIVFNRAVVTNNTGAGNMHLAFAGTGITVFAGNEGNEIAGDFEIRSGTVRFAKTGGAVAFTGDVSPYNYVRIGNQNQSGTPGTAVLETTENEQFSGNTPMRITQSGLFQVGNTSQSINQLFMDGGDVQIGSSGSLGVNWWLFGNAASTPRTSTVSGGTVVLRAANTNFTTTYREDGGGNEVGLEISSVIAGQQADYGFTKQESGTLRLFGSESNTFGGAAVVQDGTLILDKSEGAIALSGSDVVLEGGRIVWEGNQQVAATANLTLAGGSAELQGYDQSFAQLIVDAEGSVSIDFGVDSSSTLFFLDGTYEGGTLTVLNWSETVAWLMESNPSSFLAEIGSNLIFDGYGTGGMAIQSGEYWAIVPVPEPGVYALLGSLLLLGIYSVRRRQ